LRYSYNTYHNYKPKVILQYDISKYPIRKKKIILITARVHASEVTSSFEIEGILHFLTSNDSLAIHLRDLFTFKIIPMLNPEGVVLGNSRVSLTGSDLNRRWDQPDEYLHPQIYFLKNLIRMSDIKDISVFCDLHSHTKKNNAFIYGCNRAANDNFCSWTKVRLLPRILATKTPMFSYNDCVFHVGTNKWRTGRAVMWKEFGVTNSFTLECSVFGYLRGDKIVRFEVKDYLNLSLSFLETLIEYHYVLEKLQKELVLTNGWLKPARLSAVTGTLASEELAKKIEIEKREERVRRRILKLKEAANKINRYSKSPTAKLYKDALNKSKAAHKKKINIEEMSKLSSALPQNQYEDMYKENINKWRKYFEEELVATHNQLQEDIEDKDQDSDSNSSEDNLPIEEINRLLCRNNNEVVISLHNIGGELFE